MSNKPLPYVLTPGSNSLSLEIQSFWNPLQLLTTQPVKSDYFQAWRYPRRSTTHTWTQSWGQ